MDSTGRDLFRNPFFFEIGSEKKKLESFEVGDFLENPDISGIFVNEITKIREKLLQTETKFFQNNFLCFPTFPIRFGMHFFHQNHNTGKILNF